jgi:chromosome partitioning protein
MDRIIRERFGNKVFETVIPKSVRISEAELEGEPLVLLDARAAAARSYVALADEAMRRSAAITTVL